MKSPNKNGECIGVDEEWIEDSVASALKYSVGNLVHRKTEVERLGE